MVQRSGPWSRHTKWAVAAALMTLIAVLLYANLTTPDQAVEHPIAHRYDTRDPRFQTTMTHLLGSPVVPGNRVTALLNGDQAFPAMLEAIRSAKHSITLEAYIFWPGTDGDDLRRGARRASPRRGGDPPDSRRHGLAEAGRRGGRGHAAGGSAGGLVPSGPVVQPGSRQPSHPPEAPDRGRPRGLHRRARHRGSLPGPRAGRRSLARRAVPRRGAGGGPAAGRVPGQLDRDRRRAAARDGLLPGTRLSRRRAGPGGSQLARRRHREPAAHVPAGHRLGAAEHPDRESRTSSPTPSP